MSINKGLSIFVALILTIAISIIFYSLDAKVNKWIVSLSYILIAGGIFFIYKTKSPKS